LLKKVPPLKYYISIESIFINFIRKIQLPVNPYKKKLDNDIDFLIRYERIDEDFEKVCNYLDIPFFHLDRINKSNRKNYSIYYDEELKELVRRKFIEEIEFCQYKF